MIIYNKQIVPTLEDQNRLEKLGRLSNLLFFDIETTGFNRIYDYIISITFMYYEKEIWQVKQLFAESPKDELTLLNEAANLFNEKEIHITYNGNTFDIPFLNVKYNNYNISAPLNKSKSYDLYRIARNALSLENYKLKSIEGYLGIDRVDQISGLECIEHYKTYLATNDLQYAHLILEHNFEDVLNLLALTKLIDYLSYDTLNAFKVQYFSYDNALYYFDNLVLKNDYLEIRLWKHDSLRPLVHSQPLNNRLSFHYENGTQLIQEKDDTLFVRLPVYSKHIHGDNLLILDYESFNSEQLQAAEDNAHQNILQYNQYYVYENLSKLLIRLFEKTIE